VHRDLIDRGCLAGMGRGLNCKQFVAELHDRGFDPDDAADAVYRVFGVPFNAARFYVRSHPAWASDVPAKGTGPAEAFRREMGDQPCSYGTS
jgi:hypothetical protein